MEFGLDTIHCHRNSLRCDENPESRHYRYSSYGANTPPCCASHLVETLFFTAALFEKHGISYFICWGTHLGAVRHGGLIPWDTDVDIGIFLEDAERVRGLESTFAAHGFRLRDEPQSRLFTLYYSKVNELHLDIEVWHREGHAGTTFAWQDRARKYTIADSDLVPLRKYPFYDRELSGPRELTYLLDYYGADCLQRGRKQWIGWHTLLWKPGFTRGTELTDRAPARIDLDRDYAAANGHLGWWRRTQARALARARLWKLRAYWASLRERPP